MDQEEQKIVVNYLTYLPHEIWEYIITFLTVDERKDVSVVSKFFYKMLQLRRFTQEAPLTLDYCIISKLFEPVQVFTRKRDFSTIILGPGINTNYEENIEFWKNVGRSTDKIVFRNEPRALLPRKFFHLFPNLEKIEFKHFCQLFETEIPKRVKAIHANNIQNYARKYQFRELQKIQHIESFTVDTIELEHDGIYDKQYPLMKFSSELQNSFNRLEIIAPKYFSIHPVNLIHASEIEASFVKEIPRVDITMRKHFEAILPLANLTHLHLKMNFFGCLMFHREHIFANLKSLQISSADVNPPGDERYKVQMCEQCIDLVGKNFCNITEFNCSRVLIYNLQELINKIQKPLKRMSMSLIRSQKVVFTFKDFEYLKITSVGRMGLSFDNWQIARVQRLVIGDKIRFDFVNLVKSIPNVKHFHCNRDEKLEIDTEVLRAIHKHWPRLKTLDCMIDFQNISQRSLDLLGGFRHLRFLGKRKGYRDGNVEHFKLFDRIPTLREGPYMDFDEYCYKKHFSNLNENKKMDQS